jgi:hypothetical protein
LSNITHRPDAPWTKVYSQFRFGAIIEPSEIRDYFKLLKGRDDDEAALTD